MATTTPNFGWPVPTSTDLVKDGATAIEGLGDAIDASLLDLKGGTTNQVLAKNSNTDMDFKWVADASGIPATIIDAKGDLIAGTAADTASRLAVGANGTVLTADSAEATGLKWAAAGGGGQNWSLLNAGGTALTVATTTTISGISSKNQIAVLINQASTVNNQSEISVRINTDTASNYYPYGFQNINTSTYNAANMGFSVSGASSSILLGKTQEVSANGTLTGSCFISGANASGVKFFQSLGSGYSTTSASGHATAWTMGVYDSSSTVSSVSVFSNSGNFDAGSVFVYTTA